MNKKNIVRESLVIPDENKMVKKKSLLNTSNMIIRGIIVIIAIIWVGGMLVEFFKSINNNNISFFVHYGQISLTLFGFTFISAIFEKNKKAPKIVKKLFHLSLVFLLSAVSHFFLYSLSFLNFEGATQIYIIIPVAYAAVLLGFLGFVYGILFLTYVLIDYSKQL